MSNKKIKWKTSEIVKLLDMVRARPILWDRDHPKFRISFQRDLAFDEVSYEMNTTNTIIKNKIQILRCQYLKELRKLKSTKNHKPIWKHFERMKFIFKHDKENFKSEIAADDSPNNDSPINYEISNIDNDNSPNTLSTNPAKQEFSNFDNDDSPYTVMSPMKLDISYTDKPLDDVYGIKEEYITDEGDMEESQSCKRHRESKPENIKSVQIKDDFRFFGQHIANELRLLNDYQDIQEELRSKIIFALKEAKLAAIKARQLQDNY